MRDFDDLERLIDRELRRLPSPRASETLLPRVMAAAGAQSRPVVGRPAMPVHDVWRLAAAAAAALFVVLAGRAWSVHDWSIGGRMGDLVEAAATAAILARVFYQTLFEPLVMYAAVLVLVLAFVSSACWAALRSLALEGVSQS